ncbi:MAG TPA: response regulator [Pyrinomonadaceae bacterium]
MVTGRKLLLADDSVTIQKVVDLTFSDEGLEVVTTSDGQQALEKLEEFTPDIVLADVFMPGMGGYELCEHIKRTERLSHIPVMLLVGSFEPFDEEEARRVGADDYLTKPFQSIRTLIGKVRNLLAGGGSSTESSEQPTRQLAPPPEVEKENRPDTDFLERSTADTAPLPTDAHEATAREGQAREISFSDLSMDDEMIETSPAGDYVGAEQSVQSKATAQYSAADLREAGITEPAESAPESVGAYASAQAVDSAPAASVQPQAAARPSGVASADDALLDLGDLEPTPAMAEADDFLIDLLDDVPQTASASAQPSTEAAPPVAEAEPSHVDAPSASASDAAQGAWPFNVEATAASAPQAQEFIEGQVVEDTAAAEEEGAAAEAAPPAEQESRSWHETFINTQSTPTERLPEDFQFESATAAVSPAAETGTTESAAPQAGLITLEQLSPEVIDAIARRAVEQLSERVVEQIAWEVVPQLAELLIKRRLEEKSDQ